MYNLNMTQQLTYFSVPACGFITDNTYELTITEANPAGYIITAKYNITKDEDVDIQIYLSSENSVMRYFKEPE